MRQRLPGPERMSGKSRRRVKTCRFYIAKQGYVHKTRNSAYNFALLMQKKGGLLDFLHINCYNNVQKGRDIMRKFDRTNMKYNNPAGDLLTELEAADLTSNKVDSLASSGVVCTISVECGSIFTLACC